MLINSVVVRAYLIRGAALWAATRFLCSAAFLLGGINPLRFASSTVVELVGVSVVIGIAETHRRREQVLLANLGVRPLLLYLMLALPPVLEESALSVASEVLW
ncbi:MAG: hypothetical protein M3Z05_14100 [Gemmatimonadota bacterium]|nr:hypothetical protein [Gemmatimonadota bacterium]